MLIVYLIHISTFAILINVTQRKVRTGIIHFSIQIVYSLVCAFSMNYHRADGTALVYFVFWVSTLALHWVVYIGLIAWNLLNRGRQKQTEQK